MVAFGENAMSTDRPLAGKTALITGASRGIGFAIAETLGKLGAKLGICARDAKRLDAAAAQLREREHEVFADRVDVTRAAEIAALVAKTEQTLGPIEILVNNAGIGYFGPIQNASEETWDSVLDTNLKAVFLVTKAVVPGMIQRKSGHVINIASLAGKNTFKNGAVYCASKWGLMGLTGCMAEDLREFGIRASAICPGSVNTEFSHSSSKDSTKVLQSEDIAHAVAMLVTQSPQSFISEVLMRPTQKP
jgi:3-oxoacyl-[acyl-carrier protein] reductase